MDYDKLIERLSRYSEPVIAYKLDGDFAAAVTEAVAELHGKCAGCSVPATIAEMIRDLNDAPKLRAENEQLRADLAQMAACVYYKAGGLCQCGGDDPANVCVMGPCPHEISVFDLTQLIHHVRLRLEDVKSERDAAVKDLNEFLAMEELCPIQCEWCKWKDTFCDGKTPEWRGPQKED